MLAFFNTNALAPLSAKAATCAGTNAPVSCPVAEAKPARIVFAASNGGRDACAAVSASNDADKAADRVTPRRVSRRPSAAQA